MLAYVMQCSSLFNHILYVFELEYLAVIHLALAALTLHLHVSFHIPSGVRRFSFQSLRVGRSGIYTVIFQSFRVGQSDVYIVAFQSLRVGRSDVCTVAFQSLRVGRSGVYTVAFQSFLHHCLSKFKSRPIRCLHRCL